MNEYQRQAYLMALGVENYMPRWSLPAAPAPQVCVLPVISVTNTTTHFFSAENEPYQFAAPEDLKTPKMNRVAAADVLRDLVEPHKASALLGVKSRQFEPEMPETISPFALSIWRPLRDLLVIDSRNTHLALPTELLLRNILYAIFGAQTLPGVEEILRWPLIENAMISCTEKDARNTLQVWLEVELDRCPVTHLLLFGRNAAHYFLPDDHRYEQSLWQWLNVSPSVQTLIAPSLAELLQQPLLKRNLWQCLTHLQRIV